MVWPLRIIVSLSLALAPLTAMPEDPKPAPFEAKNCSSVKIWKDESGDIHRLTRNVRYAFLRVDGVDPKGDVPVLLEEVIEKDQPEGQEGSISKITTRAFWVRPDLSVTEIWTVSNTDEAAEICFVDETVPLYLKTTRFGCCGSESVRHFYELATGRMVMTCSEEAFAVVGARKESRLGVTYWSSEACMWFTWPKDGSSPPDGLLTLNAKDVPVSRCYVWGLAGSPKVELTGNKVTLTFSRSEHVTIPISRAGLLDVENVTPKGVITLKPMPDTDSRKK